MSGHTHARTHAHTHTHYYNPRCAHAHRGLTIFKYGNSNTRVTPHVHCYEFYAYLYCVYALVGGAISIRDPYIRAVSRACANGSLAVFHKPVVCAVKT